MSRLTYTGVTEYLSMPIGMVRRLRKALGNVLEKEREAREESKQ